MSGISRLRPQPDHRLRFLQGFFARPREVASIVPSSRFLERRLIRCAEAREAGIVVELGPGTGGTTRALLHAMRPDAKLLAIEINPRFARLLRHTRDPRLVVHCGSASEIGAALEIHDLPRPDVIISGIPFSTMTRRMATEILCSVHDALGPGGRFVAYQVRDRIADLGRGVFGHANVQTELFNVPPMRVYRWVKDGVAVAPAVRRLHRA
jgi:phospholipid N-methyltransferase